jgi:hypothetical protein
VKASLTSAAVQGLIEVLLAALADFFAAGACSDLTARNFADFLCLGFAATPPQAVNVFLVAAGFGLLGGLRVLFGMIVYT